MGKNQEERKPPIIVVKKRRTFSLPSLSEKTDLSPASHVMAWMVTPKGRSQTLKHRVPVADWRH